MDAKKVENIKIEKNNVKSRFLELCPSAAKGLEPEGKIQDFSIKDVLGEGSFGKVYKVEHLKTKAIYAIKAIDKRNKNNQEGKPYFRREIEIMYKVHHPNIVKLFSHFEDDYFCYFVMEYISKGNLFQLKSKQKSKCFDTKTVASMMRDVISATYYLHNMDPTIIHRDIKPENVLIDDSNRLKLTDFGWSNYISDETVRSTYCGTPIYLAPEMIKEVGHDENLDIWCIGVLMFELLAGYPPFSGTNINNLSDNILKGKIQWPQDISAEAKDLLSKILKTDPKERLGLKQILNHPLFTKVNPPPDFALITPAEQSEEELRTYVLSVDIPSLKTEQKKKKILTGASDMNIKEKVVNGKENQTDSPNQEVDLLKKKLEEMKKALLDQDEAYKEIKRKYDQIVKDSKEFSQKNLALNKEKDDLLKELESNANSIIELKKKISEFNDKIESKESKIKILQKSMKITEEKAEKLEIQIKKLEDDYENYKQKTELEKDELQNQINCLEEKLTHQLENEHENRISNLRESLSTLREGSTVGNFDKEDIFKSNIENVKNEFLKEIDNIKKDYSKEKENLLNIIKSKDDNIKKLEEEKKFVKIQTEKIYDLKIYKLNLQLTTKDAEIEKLNAIIKKNENKLKNK